MKRRTLLKTFAGVLPALAMPELLSAYQPFSPAQTGEMIESGPFQPTWDSLQSYVTPEWFRNAKFGIWAHWGPQCQPEHGDWYARSMYMEGSDDYKFHLQKYGHPSKFGFKDVIPHWKAEKWDPGQLVALYQRAGAKYFFALANHHDNFDTYNSKYQPWNSTRLGPKKDLISGWAKAARNNGLKFGVSVHAAHAWMFYEKAQKADASGPYKGVPYDGNISLAAGKGKWWESLDPQDLYAQHHQPGINADKDEVFFTQWDWTHGASIPNKKYCDKFFNRTIDLINKYEPDLVYFDDTVLPLWPISDAGLRIAAHLYNISSKKHGGRVETIITGKILNEMQRKCMVWDIERGQSNGIEPLPWQTDTCIGNWHYDRALYETKGYKTAKTIIHRLADIVSKNGNLLLNIPVRGDGTIDELELGIVEEIGAWMKINAESIFDTRPWKVFGEGPAMESAAALSDQGFNENSDKPFTYEDIRFTVKSDTLYAIALGTPPRGTVLIKSLAADSVLYPKIIERTTMPGSDEPLVMVRSKDGLLIRLPESMPEQAAYVFKIV